MKRTDLALELAPRTKIKRAKQLANHIKVSRVEVDDELSRALNKPKGNYVTVESRAVPTFRPDLYDEVSQALSAELKKIVGEVKSVMVVGLGNPNMTADSLGSIVAKKLMITRHIKQEGEVALSVITPNVLGVTGIESFEVVAGVTERVKPEVIIAVDSLSSAATSRIASAFQISDAGITPGSGISNHRARLDKESLGVRVLSMGVPLVVYASTIIADALGKEVDFDEEIGGMVVTPKDIDLFVEDCAVIVAEAINKTFF